MNREIKEVYHLRNELNNQPYSHKVDDEDRSLQILHEIDIAGQHYAIMRQEQDHPEDAYLYRIQDGQALEIDDENEWETVVDQIEEHLISYDH